MRLVTRIATVVCGLAVVLGSTGCALRSSDATVVKNHTVMRRRHEHRLPRMHRRVHADRVTAVTGSTTD